MTLGNNLMRLTSPLRWIGRNIKEGRQRTANQQIARMLQETEYRNESVDTVYRALCRQDLSSLRGYPTK
jgi:Fe2+ or Zn2+ uptake regulation protein